MLYVKYIHIHTYIYIYIYIYIYMYIYYIEYIVIHIRKFYGVNDTYMFATIVDYIIEYDSNYRYK